EPESPIGPLIADATAEGYQRDPSGRPAPFHGYYYKVLTGQGADAPGGALDYVADGKMTRGFAFLAYPADYRASGVMTFMIDILSSWSRRTWAPTRRKSHQPLPPSIRIRVGSSCKRRRTRNQRSGAVR